MKYPYEVQIRKADIISCMPAESQQKALEYIQKYAKGFTGQVTKRISEYGLNPYATIWSFDENGNITKHKNPEIKTIGRFKEALCI